MKRISTLHGMGWLVLSLIFQTSDTAAVAAQEINEATSPIQRTPSSDASLDYWTGRIEQDTTWRDTVYVGGDVTIASGATLTLEPDTQVHFLPYHDDTQGGLDSTRAELIVEGRLYAQAEGIVFRSAAAASLGADWYGIVVERGGFADVSHATIRDGRRCLYAEMGGRVTMDHVAFTNCEKPSQAELEATHSDSLSEKMEAIGKRYYTKAAKQENSGLRILKKVGVGTFSGTAFTLMAIGVHEKIWESSRDLDGVGHFLFYGGGIGWSVGFSLGVSSVDPYDSLPKTLLAGVIPGAVEIGFLFLMGNSMTEGLWMLSVGPVISSLIASELSRKPPQDRRFSVGLVPAPKGNLSVVAALRF